MSTLPIAAATGVAALVAGRVTAAGTIRRLRRQLALALWLCEHDPLTGLPNRARAEYLFARRTAAGRPTALVLLDLDGFRQVNDTHGHDAGDQLLVTITARLARTTAGYGGHAARLAGDKFLLLLPIRPDGLRRQVEAILRVLAAPVEVTTEQTVRLRPTATAGVSFHNGVSGSWNTLLRQADLALYHARAHERGWELYRPGMRMPDRPYRYGPRLRDQRPQATP